MMMSTGSSSSERQLQYLELGLAGHDERGLAGAGNVLAADSHSVAVDRHDGEDGILYLIERAGVDGLRGVFAYGVNGLADHLAQGL